MHSADIARAVAVGIGATLFMDLWNLFLRRAFGVASLDFCLLGRWLLHVPAGRLVHENIRAAVPKRLECGVGWLGHYSIGVAFAVAFVALVSGDWLTRPSLAPALVYGVVTVVFPFFLLQPALGLGIASSHAPSPAAARLKSLATHAAFGVGLYLAALALCAVLRLVV